MTIIEEKITRHLTAVASAGHGFLGFLTLFFFFDETSHRCSLLHPLCWRLVAGITSSDVFPRHFSGVICHCTVWKCLGTPVGGMRDKYRRQAVNFGILVRIPCSKFRFQSRRNTGYFHPETFFFFFHACTAYTEVSIITHSTAVASPLYVFWIFRSRFLSFWTKLRTRVSWLVPEIIRVCSFFFFLAVSIAGSLGSHRFLRPVNTLETQKTGQQSRKKKKDQHGWLRAPKKEHVCKGSSKKKEKCKKRTKNRKNTLFWISIVNQPWLMTNTSTKMINQL